MVPLPQTSQLVVRFLAYRITTTGGGGGGGGARRPREQGSGQDLRQDYDDQRRGFDGQQRASRCLLFSVKTTCARWMGEEEGGHGADARVLWEMGVGFFFPVPPFR